ncbi:UNVERIFIED_CONTAM: hypothetical protein K2H54_001259 [Gekko kuhli]
MESLSADLFILMKVKGLKVQRGLTLQWHPLASLDVGNTGEEEIPEVILADEMTKMLHEQYLNHRCNLEVHQMYVNHKSNPEIPDNQSSRGTEETVHNGKNAPECCSTQEVGG